MGLLIKMAARNLWRNRRRSLITASAIALGLGLLMFSSGGTDGMTNSMIAKGVGSAAGHVVIQGEGWQEDREADIVVPDTPAVAARLAEAVPDALIVQRVFMEGLLTSPSGAMGVAVTGAEPDREAQVNGIADRLVDGMYLDEDHTGIVLGSILAETLDVDLGDKVVLMAQGEEEIESRLFRVKGVFSMGIEEIDGFYAQVPLASAQDLLGLGADVTQITAHLDSARDAEDAVTAARTAFAGEALEVLGWAEALPDLAQYVAAEQGEIVVFYVIIFAMVALGIVNTVLMSVLERMKEFGVMLSLGASPRRLASLVLTEAGLLGAFAAGVGVLLGLVPNLYFAKHGLDMSQLVGGTVEVSGFALDMIIYTDLDPAKVAGYVLAVWLMTMAAALYPAFKAATLRPVECLQHQ